MKSVKKKLFLFWGIRIYNFLKDKINLLFILELFTLYFFFTYYIYKVMNIKKINFMKLLK